jgi:hypothetical protein
MTKNHQINVRVTNQEIASLRELAAQRSVRISELVRTVLAQEVKQAEPNWIVGRLFPRLTSPTA